MAKTKKNEDEDDDGDEDAVDEGGEESECGGDWGAQARRKMAEQLGEEAIGEFGGMGAKEEEGRMDVQVGEGDIAEGSANGGRSWPWRKF